MNHSAAELFVILALNPEKGRVSVDRIHFTYSLTGALFMDYLDRGEFTIENKRVIPSFRINGDQIHDMIAEKIMRSGRNRRLSVWIKQMIFKNRIFFREITNSLEKQGILRIEHKKFLNLFPYKRYWFNDISIRNNLVELLRGILLYGKQPGKREVMLLGLVDASMLYKLLSREKGESKLLRKKNIDLLKDDVFTAEIDQAIKEVHAAIVASVTAATIAAHSSH